MKYGLILLSIVLLIIGTAAYPRAENLPTMTNSIGMKFVLIPAGKYTRGSPVHETLRKSWETEHEVTISKPFYMQTMEVTLDQWRMFVKATGYKTEAEAGKGAYIHQANGFYEIHKENYWDHPGFSQTGKHPVTCVSWNDAQQFIKWLNKKEGTDKYRLPTDAQWEYAIRAGKQTAFWWGDDYKQVCLYENVWDHTAAKKLKEWLNDSECDDGYVYTAPVGSFKPNGFGLYDMAGNVSEWCADYWSTYSKAPLVDPTGPSDGLSRIARGGSWASTFPGFRSAKIGKAMDVARDDTLGFRLVRGE